MRHVGERVIGVAPWSSFRGKRGVVTQTEPFLMVRVDEDERPIRMGDGEVIAEQSEHLARACRLHAEALAVNRLRLARCTEAEADLARALDAALAAREELLESQDLVIETAVLVSRRREEGGQ